MIRKSNCWLLTLVLAIFLVLPAGALAAPEDKVSSAPAGGEQAGVSLEQAIKIARAVFTVPEGFDQFSTGYDQSEKRSFWELRWYRSSEPGGDMNVRVNAATGEIWSMYRWIPPQPGQSYRGLPRYTREQAEVTATDLAKKLYPQHFAETVLQPARDYIPPLLPQERGQVEYRYNYTRLVNGVPYRENGINITVSGDTGEVLNFELRWDETTGFPPASGRLSQERAEQIFYAEASPQLFYFRPPVPGGRDVPLKLVYRLPGPRDQVLIDALSGKLLNPDEYYIYYDEGFYGGGGDAMMSDARKGLNLTPVEEGAVEDTKNLLSREKALEAAKSFVKVPQDFALKNSRLEQDYLFKEKKVWRFNWQSGEGENRKWLEVMVDASTGELVSFYTEINRAVYDYSKTPEVKYSEEEARKIAGEYIQKLQPGKWGQLVFKSSRPEPMPLVKGPGGQLPRSYSFYWSRVAGGIEFPDNGFSLDVDSSTGDVIRYHMNWWDVAFPEPRGVIGQEKAAARHLQEAPLSAAYLRLMPRDKWESSIEEARVHLVYHLARKNFAMLDAVTGLPLDFQGNAVSTTDNKVKFDDLQGHPAREAVELLARLGIVSGRDGKFRPDDAVTQAELITMLTRSSGRYAESAGKPGEPWYSPYYTAALRQGIIEAGEKAQPDSPVDRETLARLTVHTMGFNKVARLGDIYILNFKDASEISNHLRGHAALSAGLGLLQPVEGKFNPKGVVTRGEAAVTILRMLSSL